MSSPLLAVEDLRVTFDTDRETVYAVDRVSFDVREGETVAVVGESGSGKTVTARSLLGFVDAPGRVHDGSVVRFRGDQVTGDGPGLESLRGSEIAMVFQDALAALNPVYTVGNQIEEAIEYQQSGSSQDTVVDLLEAVGIPDAPRRAKEYPHEFSGGMRQRALLALALACDPDLLVLDEPTTALDVVTQAQILDLLQDLQEDRDLSLLLVTHDMGVVAQVADRVNVMYAGEIVETAPAAELFDDPKHPYTRGLLASVPRIRGEVSLDAIPGEVPTPTEPATQCRFAPRCPDAFDACERVHPVDVPVAGTAENHTAACLLYPDGVERGAAVDRHAAENGGDGS